MEKLTQNCSFVILDDYSYYVSHGNKHGKLLLIDPYDTETLQIFFDTDTDENPEKVDIIDVVTKKRLDREYCLNKFLVNVEPYRAILDINYFNNKIEECINNRKAELLKMQGKETPIIPLNENLNFENEVRKIPGSNYLQMTVLPLLHNALSMCDMIRPQDPISFIANFMLMNKDTTRKLEDIIKEIPKEIREDNIEQINQEEEQEEEAQEEQIVEEKKEEEKVEVVNKEPEKPPVNEKESKKGDKSKNNSRPGTNSSKTKTKQVKS